MRERLVYLADAETLPNAGTFIKNIDITDPITALDIIISATTGATSCTDHEIHDDVDKVEVVDGADVLHSLTMIEEQALNCFEHDRFPWFDFDEGAAKTVREGCKVMFGRTYRDQEIYLNPKNFKNPQLRVTYSLDISATVGFATGTGTITVIAHVLEEPKGPYRGFLMSKEHYNYTGVASAHEYVDLPVDYPYRMLMLKSLLTTYGWEELVDRIKLHADREKFVKLEMRGRDLFMMNTNEFDPLVQLKTLYTANLGTALMDLYYPTEISGFPDVTKVITNPCVKNAEKITINNLSGTVGDTKLAAAATGAVKVSFEGYQPHSCVAIPMGDLMEPDEWWDVTKYGTVTLDVLLTSAGTPANAVVLQQLRK